MSMGDNNPSLYPPHYGYHDGAGEASRLQDVGWVLLDLNAYIADRENSTSAWAAMSNGEKTIRVRVTLCGAPTPLVSYICVWCPGLQTTEMLAMRPSIYAAESDLLLLRVTVSRNKAGFFVYKANGGPNGAPSLRPIHIPAACLAHRYTIVLLAHRDITRRFNDDAGHYYLASISIDCCSSESTQFSFWLFDSSKGEKWSRLPFSLNGDLPSHITTKAISLRQDGLVGFVDPLRGIVICDVLCPGTQRYMPLPLGAIRREDFWSDPMLFRDVAVVRGRLTLVELRHIVQPGSNLSPRWTWEVSTWSRQVTRGWEQDWRPDYKVQSDDISVDMNTDNISLLPKVKDNQGLLRPSLERLYTALPVLSLSNEGVVYIMGKVGHAQDKALVLSINMMRRKLQGVAMFDAERMVGVTFSYTCTQSRIPEYLNPGLKRKQKRPGMFNMGYPHKLSHSTNEEYDAFYAQMQLSGGAEEQQDTGAGKGAGTIRWC